MARSKIAQAALASIADKREENEAFYLALQTQLSQAITQKNYDDFCALLQQGAILDAEIIKQINAALIEDRQRNLVGHDLLLWHIVKKAKQDLQIQKIKRYLAFATPALFLSPLVLQFLLSDQALELLKINAIAIPGLVVAIASLSSAIYRILKKEDEDDKLIPVEDAILYQQNKFKIDHYHATLYWGTLTVYYAAGLYNFLHALEITNHIMTAAQATQAATSVSIVGAVAFTVSSAIKIGFDCYKLHRTNEAIKKLQSNEEIAPAEKHSRLCYLEARREKLHLKIAVGVAVVVFMAAWAFAPLALGMSAVAIGITATAITAWIASTIWLKYKSKKIDEKYRAKALAGPDSQQAKEPVSASPEIKAEKSNRFGRFCKSSLAFFKTRSVDKPLSSETSDALVTQSVQLQA